MPLSPTLHELVTYNDWARSRLLAALAAAGDAVLDRAPAGLGGPARATVQHVWAAERLWLDRWLGQQRAPLPEMESGLSIAALAERFATADRERDAFFAGLDSARDEERRVTYVNRLGETWTYPLGDMVLHVVNHGVHHHSQAVSLLRDAGVASPPLDYLFLLLARPTLAQSPAALAALRAGGIEAGESVTAPARLSGDLLARYGRFGDWAQEQVLAAAAPLAASDLDRRFGFGPGGTLRKTLLHIRDAEQHWLEVWSGRKTGPGLAELPGDTPIDALAGRWRETTTARAAFLAGLDDEGLARPVTTLLDAELGLGFRIGESALQLRMHGTHHRAQAGMMLRALGAKLPAMDYLNWYDATCPRLPPAA